MARVSVQHLVLNRLTRRYGHRLTSDLLGVEYVLEVPADTEFPKSVTQFDVFVRMVVKKTSTVRARLRVRWLDPPVGKAVDGVNPGCKAGSWRKLDIISRQKTFSSMLLP